jgi:carboxypeptidase C (cathepsin A)
MLYIESPAGVGYSIANKTEDYTQNDMSQGSDAFIALMAWYDKFPEYAANDLYVSGESYGGIYVPYLSWFIYQNNLQAKFDASLMTVNQKGFMVGNGATDWKYDVSPSFPEVVYNFNMIPESLWTAYNNLDCVEYFDGSVNGTDPTQCSDMFDQMATFTNGLNWYDLYRYVYPDASKKLVDRKGMTMVNGQEKHYKRGMTHKEYTPWAKHIKQDESNVMNDFLSDYVNN